MPSYLDITGRRYGKLTALYPTDKRSGTNIIWCFRCDCGNLVERTTCHIPKDAACSTCKPRGVNVRKDYSGQRFGRLVALNCTGEHKGKELIWKLQCDCGNIVELPVSKFISGNTKSCGCLRKDAPKRKQSSWNGPNPKFTDLTGQKYGMLTVIERAQIQTPRGRVQWICRCDCGNELIVSTSDLADGQKRSCGCTDARLFCVFKHVFPDDRIYVGITAKRPWRAWFSGSKYLNQTSMQQAIDSIGGYEEFKVIAKHYYYTPDGQWMAISGPLPFPETNFFSENEAGDLKKKFILEYRSSEPDFGLNAVTGIRKGFSYSAIARERQSKTKSGEDNRNDWCVYIHTNRENGKKYVGVTCRDPKTRWSNGNGYRRPAKQGLETSHFYKAIQKYGWESFDHEIIQTGMTKDEAAELEMKLIAEYDTQNPEKGYNITAGGDGSTGAAHTEETKKKLSRMMKERIANTGNVNFKGQHHSDATKAILRERMLGKYDGDKNPFAGKHHSKETRKRLSEQHSIPVNQYSLKGEFIRQYASATEAALDVGTTPTSIVYAASGKTRFSAGFIWRRASEAPSVGEGINAAEIIGNSRHTGSKKPVEQCDLKGNTIKRFDSLAEAAIAVNASISNISAAARGNTKTCKGFIWKFVEC